MKTMNLLLGTMIACFALVSFAETAAPNVNADVDAIEASHTACLKKALSTLDFKDCNDDGYYKSHDLLDKVYNDIAGGLQKSTFSQDKEILNRLETSQKAWLAYREADCSYKGTEMLGGSGESVVIGGCEFDMTQARIKALRAVEQGN